MARNPITLAEIMDDVTNPFPLNVNPASPLFATTHDYSGSVTLTMNHLQRSLRLRQRINTLVHGYYLGMLYANGTRQQQKQIYRTTKLEFADLRKLKLNELQQLTEEDHA
ncbi:2577_t:CDS:2, partial [Racocetra fulgida]